jgi:hypothetical protein
LTVNIDNITQTNGWEYIVELSYIKGKNISKAKANFSVSKGKIIRSFIMK